jgi:hypothetical protein
LLSGRQAFHEPTGGTAQVATVPYNNNNNNNNNNNTPDIIIGDNEKETCMLIDVAISGDRNVIKKEAEKILKYEDLTIEIQHM